MLATWCRVMSVATVAAVAVFMGELGYISHSLS